MQMLWRKGALKFEFTKRCKMPDTQPFCGGGRLEGLQHGRKEIIVIGFIILPKMTMNQRKTFKECGEGKGRLNF